MKITRIAGAALPAVLISAAIATGAGSADASNPSCTDLFDPASNNYVGLTPGNYVCEVPGGVSAYDYVLRSGYGGARNYTNAGKGVKIVGTITVSAGVTLYVTVGNSGAPATGNTGGAGGGYSSIADASSPWVIAGGGGGAGNAAGSDSPGGDGGTTTNGAAGNGAASGTSSGAVTGGTGATATNPGTGGTGYNGGEGSNGGGVGSNGLATTSSNGGGGGGGWQLTGATAGATPTSCTPGSAIPAVQFGAGGGACYGGGGGGGYRGGGGGGAISFSHQYGGGGGGGGSSLIPAGAVATTTDSSIADRAPRLELIAQAAPTPTPTPPPAPTPAMTPASQVLTGTVDAAVTPTSPFTLENFTMPVRYSVYPALPAGLTLDPATGVVSGTPTVAYPSTRHWITAATAGNSESAYSTLQVVVNAKLPSAPRDVAASKAGPGSAKVSWAVPASDGGAAITAYRVVSAPGSGACTTAAPALTCTVTGLTNGTSYTFTVEAENSAGWGPESAASNAVTPDDITPAPDPQPLPAPLDPGQSNLQTNGVVDPNVQVDPNNKSDGLVISGDGWNMDLDGLGPDGKPLNLGPDGSLRLANERDVATEGTGFLPNSEVDLYVDPPVLLTEASAGPGARLGARADGQGIYVGTVRTDAQGSFTGTATLPEDILPGDHVLQAVGYSPSRQSRAMSLGVIVEPWIVLDQGARKAEGMHDRIRTTGSSGGIDAGVKLTPWIRYAGQSAFKQGVASITVQSDGSFKWTREIKKSKGLTAYVSYVDVESNRVFWAKVR